MFTNDVVIQKNINGYNYLQFKKLLEYNVNNAFFLNELSFSFKNQPYEITENNLKKVCKDLGFNFDRLSRPIQLHSANAKIIEKTGINIPEFDNTDALITDKLNTPLAITTADCIPIIVFDKGKRILANVHSGWHGTLNKIIINTINQMINTFHSQKEDLLFFFGPSLCQNCFEVDEDVMLMFKNAFSDLNDIDIIIKKGQIKDNKQKYHIDTVLLNKNILLNFGIKKGNMFFANICTCCHSDYFHSYRARTKDSFGLGITIASL